MKLIVIAKEVGWDVKDNFGTKFVVIAVVRRDFLASTSHIYDVAKMLPTWGVPVDHK